MTLTVYTFQRLTHHQALYREMEGGKAANGMTILGSAVKINYGNATLGRTVGTLFRKPTRSQGGV